MIIGMNICLFYDKQVVIGKAYLKARKLPLPSQGFHKGSLDIPRLQIISIC